MNEEPNRLPTFDGIYTRCVWCNGEIYGPNVIDYSLGDAGCHQCGKALPDGYVKLDMHNEGTPDHPDITSPQEPVYD